MNIPYASPIVRATIDGSNVATHLDELEDALVAAEWDLESSVLATQTGTFTGLPSNTQTVTIGATVYRFVNTLAAAFDVKIGASATECATNLAAAINDTSGEGTLYGTGTTAHPSVTATSSGGTVTISAITTGGGGNGISLSETLANFAWTANATAGGGFVALTRADHPCGYRLRFYGFVNSSGVARYRISAQAAVSTKEETWLTMSGGRSYMVRATPYDVWIILLGSSGTDPSAFFYCGALWNPEEWKAPDITDITTGATTTIEQAGHGLTTGNTITLSGLAGSVSWLAENGKSYAITVVDANSYTIALDSSSFGTPTDTAGVFGGAGSSDHISLSIVACGSKNISTLAQGHFRNCLAQTGTSGGCDTWAHFNQHAISLITTTSNQGALRVIGLASSLQTTTGTRIGLSTRYLYSPVILSHGVINLIDNSYIVGCLWNAVVYLSPSAVDQDLDQIPLDGRRFFNVRNPTGAPTHYLVGSIFIEVPVE